MASIGTLFPTTSTTASTSSTNSTTSSSATSGGTDGLANQNTFLTLLVAQLQHQDPTQPMDGTTFVTQLAQFSDLSANVGSQQDLDAIVKQYTGSAASTSSGTGTTSAVTGS